MITCDGIVVSYYTNNVIMHNIGWDESTDGAPGRDPVKISYHQLSSAENLYDVNVEYQGGPSVTHPMCTVQSIVEENS